jgi:PIN domain nuclease of toxin-antitoxin system
MNLLLDTHAFLWFMEGNERISQRARAEIEAADAQPTRSSSTNKSSTRS